MYCIVNVWGETKSWSSNPFLFSVWHCVRDDQVWMLPVTCYILCILPPLSGEPLLQRIFIHSWSVVYIYYVLITLYFIRDVEHLKKRVCHNTRTLLSYLHFYARTCKSIYRLITKTHPSMHIIVLKSKTHRCGKIQDIKKW